MQYLTHRTYSRLSAAVINIFGFLIFVQCLKDKQPHYILVDHLPRESLVWAHTVVRIPNNQDLTILAHEWKDIEGYLELG